jgi:hypothetical protein
MARLTEFHHQQPHQKVDAFADQLQSSPARVDPLIEDPIEVTLLFNVSFYSPHT